MKEVENDYEREVEYNRGSQKREKSYVDEIRQMKSCLVRTRTATQRVRLD